MAMLMRLAAAYLILLALVIAGHFLATQIYDPFLEGVSLDVWLILDKMMVAGAIIVILVAFARKRNLEPDGPVSRDYLEANFTFYYGAALLLALLWNWFGVEWVDPPNAEALLWILIDTTLPLLMASTGIRLLRKANEMA